MQKVRLHDLCRAIPAIATEKPSAILVLQHAKEYIEELNKRSQEVENEIEAITGKKSKASALSPPTSSSKSKDQRPSRSARAEETAELDGYRKENTQLKARLAELRKRLSINNPNSQKANTQDFTASQLEIMRDSSVSPPPRANSNSPSPSTLSVPPLHTDGPALSSRRPPVVSRSESSSPASSTSPHPILKHLKVRCPFPLYFFLKVSC